MAEIKINRADVNALRSIFERAEEDWQSSRQYARDEFERSSRSIDAEFKRVSKLILRAMEATRTAPKRAVETEVQS